MRIINQNMSLPRVGDVSAKKPQDINVNANQRVFENTFGDAMEKAQNAPELQFSKHAHMRLNMRDIRFTENQIARIESGIQQAEAKGIREGLILIDDVALVVNVKHNLVVTALHQKGSHVFTNIDGAVIV